MTKRRGTAFLPAAAVAQLLRGRVFPYIFIMNKTYYRRRDVAWRVVNFPTQHRHKSYIYIYIFQAWFSSPPKRRVTGRPPRARCFSWRCTFAAWPPLRGGRAWRSPGSWPPDSSGATRRSRTRRICFTCSRGRYRRCRRFACWRWARWKVSNFYIYCFKTF